MHAHEINYQLRAAGLIDYLRKEKEEMTADTLTQIQREGDSESTVLYSHHDDQLSGMLLLLLLLMSDYALDLRLLGLR